MAQTIRRSFCRENCACPALFAVKALPRDWLIFPATKCSSAKWLKPFHVRFAGKIVPVPLCSLMPPCDCDVRVILQTNDRAARPNIQTFRKNFQYCRPVSR